MTISIEEAEKKIRAKVALLPPGRLGRGDYGVILDEEGKYTVGEDRKVCLAGALLIGHTSVNINNIAIVLGCTDIEMDAIEGGFEGWGRHDVRAPEWFALGKRLGEEFLGPI